MCQVNAKFTLGKMGDVTQMQEALATMETLNSIALTDNVLSVSFNHHKYTEREIARAIEAHGFEVKSVE